MALKIVKKSGSTSSTVKTVLERKDFFFANEAFLDDFERRYRDFAYEVDSSDSYAPNMIAYYGMPGSGKSILLEQIRKRNEERKADQFHWVHLDFSHGENDREMDGRQILSKIRNQLDDRYGASFPLYDLGVLMLSKKLGESIDINQRGREESDFSSAVDSITAIGKELPVVGMAAHIFNLAKKGFKLAKKLIECHDNELNMIEKADPENLKKIFPLLFSLDFRDYAEQQKQPMAIFLDSAEQVSKWEWLKGGLDEFGVKWDESNALLLLPKVLWVSASRKRFAWIEDEEDLKDVVHQVEIPALTEEKALSWLECVDAPVEQKEKVLKLVCGNCRLLGAAVEQSLDEHQILEKKKKLVPYFLKNLDAGSVEIACILVILEKWTDETFRSLSLKLLMNQMLYTGDAEQVKKAYADLKQNAFIRQEGCYFVVDDLMQYVLKQSPCYGRIEECVRKFYEV